MTTSNATSGITSRKAQSDRHKQTTHHNKAGISKDRKERLQAKQKKFLKKIRIGAGVRGGGAAGGATFAACKTETESKQALKAYF